MNDNVIPLRPPEKANTEPVIPSDYWERPNTLFELLQAIERAKNENH